MQQHLARCLRDTTRHESPTGQKPQNRAPPPRPCDGTAPAVPTCTPPRRLHARARRSAGCQRYNPYVAAPDDLMRLCHPLRHARYGLSAHRGLRPPVPSLWPARELIRSTPTECVADRREREGQRAAGAPRRPRRPRTSEDVRPRRAGSTAHAVGRHISQHTSHMRTSTCPSLWSVYVKCVPSRVPSAYLELDPDRYGCTVARMVQSVRCARPYDGVLPLSLPFFFSSSTRTRKKNRCKKGEKLRGKRDNGLSRLS